MSKEQLTTICDKFNAELDRDDTKNEQQEYDHYASEQEQEDEK